jgi:hypothetical protein
MKKNFDKFFQKITKLDKYYYTLKVDLDLEYIILGVKILIKEHKECSGNLFQPRTQNIDKELPVFFMIINNSGKKSMEIASSFIQRNLPILNLEVTSNADVSSASRVQHLLESFVIKAFKL